MEIGMGKDTQRRETNGGNYEIKEGQPTALSKKDKTQ